MTGADRNARDRGQKGQGWGREKGRFFCPEIEWGGGRPWTRALLVSGSLEQQGINREAELEEEEDR